MKYVHMLSTLIILSVIAPLHSYGATYFSDFGDIYSTIGDELRAESHNSSPAVSTSGGAGNILAVGSGNGTIVFYFLDENNPDTYLDKVSPILESADGTQQFYGIIHIATLDLYNRGYTDLVIGNSTGYVSLCIQWGEYSDFKYRCDYLRSHAFNSDDSSYIRVMAPSAPALGDADGDGDLDLFVGSGDGKVHFYLNNSHDDTIDIVSFGPLVINETDQLVQSYAVPTVGDINGDGRIDLLVGSHDGTVLTCLNQGNAHCFPTPTFGGSAYGTLDVGFNASPSLSDLDSDGNLDLIIGNRLGQIKVLHGKSTDVQCATSW